MTAAPFLERGTLRRGIRVNTWAGRWEYRPWSKAYVAGTEDPFDATDNPGRSIMRSTVDFVAAEFDEAAGALQMLRTEEGAQQIREMLHNMSEAVTDLFRYPKIG